MAPPACPRCGASSPEGSASCVACGAPLQAGTSAAAQPYGTAFNPAPPPQPPYQAPGYAPQAYGAAPPGYGYPPQPFNAPGYGPMAYTYPPYGAPWGAPYGYAYYPPLEPAAKVLAKSANGVRWGAAFLDGVIVIAVYIALAAYVRPTMQSGIGPPFIFITLLWGFGYYIIPDGLGATTPAKLMTGLRVVDINLKPPTLGRMALRSLELPVWLLLGGLILLLVQSSMASSSGQSLGDRLAKTYVIRKKDLAKVPAAQG